MEKVVVFWGVASSGGGGFSRHVSAMSTSHMGLLHPCVDMFENATFLKPRALKALFLPNFLKVVAITSTFESSKNRNLCASKVLLVADTNQPRTNFEIMQDLNPSARCLWYNLTKVQNNWRIKKLPQKTCFFFGLKGFPNYARIYSDHYASDGFMKFVLAHYPLSHPGGSRAWGDRLIGVNTSGAQNMLAVSPLCHYVIWAEHARNKYYQFGDITNAALQYIQIFYIVSTKCNHVCTYIYIYIERYTTIYSGSQNFPVHPPHPLALQTCQVQQS